MSFFKKYIEITKQDLPDPNTLSYDDRCLLAFQLDMIGESKTAIANYFGVTRPTVYTYLKKATDQKISELENQTYLDKTIQRLNELETQREMHRKTLESIRASAGTEIDPVTGETIHKTSHLKPLAEIARLIRDYDKLIIDFEVMLGLLPKNNVTELFSRLSDKNPENQVDKDDLTELSDDKMTELLLNKLKQVPPQLGNTTLKEVKDEKIL